LPIWAFIVAAILLGLSLGAEVDMLAYLTSRYFGLKNFAQIFGAMFSAVMVAMSLSPLAFGAVFDHTGSYQSILALGVPLCVMAIVLVLMLRPYGERARGGPISVT
jgi:MFS family permease